jgi:tryptophan-rich sensory protein
MIRVRHDQALWIDELVVGVACEDGVDWMTWYKGLAKPTWMPAPSTIVLIGRILYPVILLGFLFVFVQAARRKVGGMVRSPA